jgi:hypothetical protein
VFHLANSKALQREEKTMEDQDRERRIRERAHNLWESQGSPHGKQEEHWLQAEHEINHENAEIEGDDLPRLDAMREAARQHRDAYLVESDTEDAEQREASPGTREQP